MNIKKKIILLTGIVIFGIIAGSTVGYFKYSRNSHENMVLKNHAVLADFSDEDMASMASLIVAGKVLEISESRWNTVDTRQPSQAKFEDMQYKEVLIIPKHIYKGSMKDSTTIKVRVYGGMYTENGQTFENFEEISPKFSKNEEVVLFLAYDDSPYNKNKSNDYYCVVGSKQGKYSANGDIVESTERKMARKDLDKKIEDYKNAENRIKRGTGKI